MAELTGYPIRRLLEQINTGQLRIPAFQRGFIWDADRVARLLDSVYKGYPFGSLLFWLTNEKLVSERKLGPFELPEPAKKHPVYYVLDGQQRVTSLFLTFQTEFPMPDDESWRAVYFDLWAEGDIQQSQFLALSAGEVEVGRHFPLSSLFDPVKYREATDRFSDDSDIRAIDKIYTVFKEASVPVQIMETEDRATVAVVFERINRQGVTLTTLELLSAWTWSEDFDLREKLDLLQEELESFAFGDIAAEPDLVLRCAAAILRGSLNVEQLVTLGGEEIRSRFDEVQNGIKGAIDFLRDQLNVRTLRTLPYPLMLAPLSVFFAVTGSAMLRPQQSQIETLKRWFWRSCFAERYSGQTVRAGNADIAAMSELRTSKDSRSLEDFPVDLRVEWFTTNNFRMGSARTATFVNMLAQFGPRSFISGNLVKLDDVLQNYNKAEFHHIYPKAFLESLDKAAPGTSERANMLANFCFLSRTDNNKIRAKAPSEYRALMPPDDAALTAILDSAIIPDVIFGDQFDVFYVLRAALLAEAAQELIYGRSSD